MKNTRFPLASVGIVAAVIFAMGAASIASAASLSGTIRYTGDKIPKMKPVDMSSNEQCQAKHSEPPLAETIVIGDDKTFENVFIRVVSGLPDKEYPVPDDPVIVNQLGCRFSPHVIGIRTNQILKVLNSDGILHNFNAKPKKMRPFNKAMPPGMKEFEHQFTRSEFPFQLNCDAHAWMGAYIGVIDHPFFSITRKGGAYEISGLDAGTYEIEVWQEFWASKFGKMKFTVTLGEGESKIVDIDFPYGKQATIKL